MSNFFENLKNLLFKSFLKKKDFQDPEKQTNNYNTQTQSNINPKKQQEPKLNNERESDETSILLEEENNRFQNNENYLSKRKLLSTSLIKNKLIPLLYLTFAFSSIAFLFISESSINSSARGAENYVSIGSDAKSEKKLFNFFKLYNLNPLVFHLFSMTTGLLGIFIVCLVHSTIYLKNLNFYRAVQKFCLIEIYLTSFFGIFSQLIHIVTGMIYFFSSFADLNAFMQKELNVSLHQFLFGVEVFFTALYGIFVCLIFNKLNKIDVLECESDQEKYAPSESFNNGRPNDNLFSYGNNNNYNNNNNSNYYNNQNQNALQIIPDNIDYKWLNYKIICVVYLVFFTVCYALLLLIKNDKINFMESNNNAYFKLNQTYLLIFLPYLLFVLNSVFYSLFYGVLKYSSTCHIELTSQNVYDKSHKNML